MPHSQGLSNNVSWVESTQFLVYTYLFKIYFNIVLPSPHRPSWGSVSCRATYHLKALLTSSIWPAYPVHFNLLDLIGLTILGERHKLWSFGTILKIFFFLPVKYRNTSVLDIRRLQSTSFCRGVISAGNLPCNSFLCHTWSEGHVEAYLCNQWIWSTDKNLRQATEDPICACHK